MYLVYLKYVSFVCISFMSCVWISSMYLMYIFYVSILHILCMHLMFSYVFILCMYLMYVSCACLKYASYLHFMHGTYLWHFPNLTCSLPWQISCVRFMLPPIRFKFLDVRHRNFMAFHLLCQILSCILDMIFQWLP